MTKTALTFGTARITNQGLDYRVDYRNVGNTLADGRPQFFTSEKYAREFCAERGLEVR